MCLHMQVGKMTVTIKQLQAKTDELTMETAALRRPPAPGADPNTAMARARQSNPGVQHQGYDPPPQQQQQQGGVGSGGGGEAVPSGALARVEDEARQRDIELDDAIQGLAVSALPCRCALTPQRTEGPLVVASPFTELVAPSRTARGVGTPVSLIAGTSSVYRVGRGWALEGDQNCKSMHTQGGG